MYFRYKRAVLVTGESWHQNHPEIVRVISQPDLDVFVGDNQMTITLQSLIKCKCHDLAANNIGNGMTTTLGCGAATKITSAQ